MSERLVILGLGNILLGDDGIGVVALHALARAVDQADPRVSLVDGGTLGLSLLDYLEADSTLIIIDAVRADHPPGTVVVLEGEDVARAAAARLSVHQVGVADLLDAAHLLGRTPRRTVLCGVVPRSITLSVERTPEVEASLPALLAAVLEEAERAGHPLQPGGRKDARAWSLVDAGRAVDL